MNKCLRVKHKVIILMKHQTQNLKVATLRNLHMRHKNLYFFNYAGFYLHLIIFLVQLYSSCKNSIIYSNNSLNVSASLLCTMTDFFEQFTVRIILSLD